MDSQKKKIIQRIRRKSRIRTKIFGTAQKPRMRVFRSLRYTYVQVIDDSSGHVLAQASTKEIPRKGLSKKESAEKIGELIAKRCNEKNVFNVVFDRGGYKYHGRIKAVAEAARKAGLKF